MGFGFLMGRRRGWVAGGESWGCDLLMKVWLEGRGRGGRTCWLAGRLGKAKDG